MSEPTGGARSRRFERGLAPRAREMNASIGFDWRLLPHDVAGSIAHARMLARQGVISAEDADAIAAGLAEVEAAIGRGELPFDQALEDIHMNIEARLVERIGEPGRRLHTGRSRNDQVATDLRLYAIAAAERLMGRIDDLRTALVDQAAAHVDTFAPGYTHLQRAQPVRLGHHMLAYNEMLRRDRGRIADAAGRASELPLGSGALAATTYPLDRESVARELGFARVTRNSLDAVGDRDFAIELVAAIALCQAHLSRLGEEIVLWMSQEFAFARLDESYCSASSLMPQKMNPDLAELVRAKVGRVAGDWVALITAIKGLPLAYNKDLQETQEPLYDAVEVLDASLEVTAGMVRHLAFEPSRLAEAASRGHLLATELADYLVSRGLPFRDAHDAAGALVRRAMEYGVELSELTIEQMREVAPAIDSDVASWLDVARAVDRRDVIGGPARARVIAEIARARSELGIRAEES